MSRMEQDQHGDVMGRVIRLSRIGVWASTLALLLAITVVAWLVITMTLGAPEEVAFLINELGIANYVDSLTPAQALVGALFAAGLNILAIFMLLEVRQLFRGFLRGGVFDVASARLLRRIGLIVALMGPVNVASDTLGGMVISFWQLGNSVHGEIAVNDTDIYAIIIGLVITAVSHIMLEAARLSEENQSFV